VKEKSGVKQTIITKALELFSEKGYEGVPVSELTEAAGITKPTLYYYFKSKEGLFEDICKIYYEQLNKLITEKAVYNPNPKNYNEDIILTLSKVTNAYFSFAKTNEAFFRITLANLSMPTSSTVYKIAEKYHFTQFKTIDSMFQIMAKTHGNLKGKSKTLTWSFLGTINSYIGLFFSGSGQLAAGKTALNDKTIQELVHQFMHGIFA
jgi:AcrR family transcriptional regulator